MTGFYHARGLSRPSLVYSSQAHSLVCHTHTPQCRILSLYFCETLSHKALPHLLFKATGIKNSLAQTRAHIYKLELSSCSWHAENFHLG